jgi:hypothetical protein
MYHFECATRAARVHGNRSAVPCFGLRLPYGNDRFAEVNLRPTEFPELGIARTRVAGQHQGRIEIRRASLGCGGKQFGLLFGLEGSRNPSGDREFQRLLAL